MLMQSKTMKKMSASRLINLYVKPSEPCSRFNWNILVYSYGRKTESFKWFWNSTEIKRLSRTLANDKNPCYRCYLYYGFRSHGPKRRDSIRWHGGRMERWNGMAEHTEYSKIRNTRNILKHGKYWIFWNAEYTEYSKTQNIWISLKRGMGGKYLKKRI